MKLNGVLPPNAWRFFALGTKFGKTDRGARFLQRHFTLHEAIKQTELFR
jgi:hypothetical protein